MPTTKIQADYDQLEQVANRFSNEADQTQRMLDQISRMVDSLQGGGWIGRGANAFYQEAEGELLPAVRRLCQSLQDASRTVQQISNMFSQAEQEASALFRRR